ncbi:hypothetical protein ABM054_18435 [Morganella morganii]|uniref:hypothetical protein n=1 Tax=Morganella morganii TaxID=582 RepID=UPI003EBCD529
MSEDKGIVGKITEAVSGAGNYLKSAFSTVKEIQDLHVDYSVREKTDELLSKLLDARQQQIELQELLISAKNRIIELEDSINQKEDWALEASKYELLKTEAGSLIYTSKKSDDDNQISTYLCPHCYEKKQKSLLQPNPINVSKGHYFIYYCPNCNSDFRMHMTPAAKEKTSGRRISHHLV